MVSAQPNFYDVMDGKGQAQFTPSKTIRSMPITRHTSRALRSSTNTAWESAPHLSWQNAFTSSPLPGIQHLPTETQAVLGASHMQFIVLHAVARQVTPLPATKALLHAETMSLDHKLDQLGYLHLSTRLPYVFHMGNTINERLLTEFQQITGATPAISKADPNPQDDRFRW